MEVYRIRILLQFSAHHQKPKSPWIFTAGFLSLCLFLIPRKQLKYPWQPKSLQTTSQNANLFPWFLHTLVLQGYPARFGVQAPKPPLQQTTCRSRVPLEHKGPMFTSSLHPSKRPTQKNIHGPETAASVYGQGYGNCKVTHVTKASESALCEGMGFLKKAVPLFFFGGNGKKKKKWRYVQQIQNSCWDWIAWWFCHFLLAYTDCIV